MVFSCYIEDDLHKRLKIQAIKHGESLKAYCMKAMEMRADKDEQDEKNK